MPHPSASVVAGALDLMVHSSRRSPVHRLTGWRDGFGIAISVPHGHRTWENGPLSIELDSTGAIPKSLIIARAAAVHIRSTHDQNLDRAVAMTGDPIAIAALFDHRTRAAVKTAIESDDLLVKLGVVRLERSWKIGDDYAPFVLEAVAKMTELGRQLSLEEVSIPRRLAKNALTDPNRTVRKRCMELLFEHFPNAEDLGVIPGTDVERLRALARAHRGEAGSRWAIEVLMNLEADEPLRADALEHLVEKFPASLPETGWLLREVSLAKPRFATAIARALGIRRNGSEEDGLVEFLRHHPRVEVKISVAAALADLGTVRSVAPLLEHAQRFFGDPVLKASAKHAIEMIQWRSKNGERGTLSLAPEPRGELSFANDLDGALSDPYRDPRE